MHHLLNMHSVETLTSVILPFLKKKIKRNHVEMMVFVWLVQKHAYRYLHFKIILVQLDPDVCDRPLEEPGRPQHQHQLQVSWKRPLETQQQCKCTAHVCNLVMSI